MSDNCVLLLSGGIDSVVLAYWATKNKYQIKESLFVNYGQDSLDREMYCARRTALALDIPLQIVDMSGTRQLFWGLLPGKYHAFMAEAASPRGNHCNDGIIAWAVAALYSILKGTPNLMAGVQGDDLGRGGNFLEFKEYFEKALSAQHSVDFHFITPFVDKSKAEVIRIGSELGVPFEETWACQSGLYTHCGQCSGCNKRKEAFLKAKVSDTVIFSV